MNIKVAVAAGKLGSIVGVIGLAIATSWTQPTLSQPVPHLVAQSLVAQKLQNLQQSNQRWIEIRLATQRLIAWEGGKPVYAVIVSTGKADAPTRSGVFAIQTRYRTASMKGENYNVPDVPYTMYYSGNYAIHGAYWHNRFGTPISHGCVNVAVNHAKWLFNWVSIGTPVVVH